MHLQGQIFLGIEQFRQDWKTRIARPGRSVRDRAENLFPMFAPKRLHGETAEGAIVHHALRLGAVHNFTGFANAHARRQSLAVKRFEAASAPNPFHKDRLEDLGLGEFLVSHRRRAFLCNAGFGVRRGGRPTFRGRVLFASATRSAFWLASRSCDRSRTNYLGHAMVIRALVKYWGPVIAWILLIFLASGDVMSAEHTSRFLVPFLRWLDPGISVETLAEIHFCVRKAAHVTEYAILALLVARAV